MFFRFSLMFVKFIYTLPSKYSVTSSHQVSYTGNFLSPDSKLKRLTTYLVTTWWLFSLSADLLDKKIQVIGSWKVEAILSRFLRNRLTPYLRQPNYLWFEMISKLALQRAKKWEVVRMMSEESDKVIHVYPTNPVL